MSVTFLTNEDKELIDQEINKNSKDIAQLKESGTGGSGVTTAQANSLWTIMQKTAFTEPLTDAELNAFKTAWGIETGGEDEPVEPDNPEITLTNISVTYTGGDVTVGTSVNDLSGITVTATYSDGSTANVTGYTLSGTIAEGENTITVTYEGLTTAFTVNGVAESDGNESTSYGLHTEKGFTGKMKTGLVSGTTKILNVDKIILDIEFITTDLPNANTWLDLVYYQHINTLAVNSSGQWVFARSPEKVTADKTPAEVMGKGRTTITFNIVPVTESNALAWYINTGSSSPEITWYNAKFYSGDTLLADLKPTANVGEMYDSVSEKSYTYDKTDGLTLVGV